ncbi:hypothetical protein [Bradyrhizobium sp. Pha-3]|uniref:hypothetical protein n=1 Tax=Bradyrhizobium TaxID=374 RepID=UPI0035D43A0C
MSHVIASTGAIGACGERSCRRGRPAHGISPHDLKDTGEPEREPSRHGPDALTTRAGSTGRAKKSKKILVRESAFGEAER